MKIGFMLNLISNTITNPHKKMERIKVKINLSKINKDKIVDRTYKNSKGEMVTVKEYAIEIVPMFNKDKHKILWENSDH